MYLSIGIDMLVLHLVFPQLPPRNTSHEWAGEWGGGGGGGEWGGGGERGKGLLCCSAAKLLLQISVTKLFDIIHFRHVNVVLYMYTQTW